MKITFFLWLWGGQTITFYTIKLQRDSNLIRFCVQYLQHVKQNLKFYFRDMGKLQESSLCRGLMLGRPSSVQIFISSVQFTTPLHQLCCAYREMSLCGLVTFWKERRHRTSNSRALRWPLCASLLLLLLLFSSLSLFSSDRVTGLVAASSKARPHARRFTTGAQSSAPRATTQKRTRRKKEKKKIYTPPGVEWRSSSCC